MTSGDPFSDLPDAGDYELQTSTGEEPRSPRRRPAGLWLVAVGLLVAAAVTAGILLWRRPSAVPVATTAAPIGAPQPLGGAADPVVVPALDDSDAFVRELVRGLSTHPLIAAWLTTDGLVRNFTVAVVNVAEGNTPAGDLRVLRPASSFAVRERGDEMVIDPRSYQRYDALAAAAASADAAGVARLYTVLKPRLEEAHGELGLSATPFDRTLERAIVVLLETPIVRDPVRVEPHGIGYAFADPRLEELTAAQKQLLRMGSGNVRAVQSSLRAIAAALGIPAGRLPPPTM